MRWVSFSSIALGAASAEYITNAWQAQDFKTLVTFGDSYTDENRLGYFASHNGSAPPVGVDLGVVRLIRSCSLVPHIAPSRPKSQLHQMLTPYNIELLQQCCIYSTDNDYRATKPPPVASSGRATPPSTPTAPSTITPSVAQSAPTKSLHALLPPSMLPSQTS